MNIWYFDVAQQTCTHAWRINTLCAAAFINKLWKPVCVFTRIGANTCAMTLLRQRKDPENRFWWLCCEIFVFVFCHLFLYFVHTRANVQNTQNASPPRAHWRKVVVCLFISRRAYARNICAMQVLQYDNEHSSYNARVRPTAPINLPQPWNDILAATHPKCLK